MLSYIIEGLQFVHCRHLPKTMFPAERLFCFASIREIPAFCARINKHGHNGGFCERVTGTIQMWNNACITRVTIRRVVEQCDRLRRTQATELSRVCVYDTTAVMCIMLHTFQRQFNCRFLDVHFEIESE